MSGSFSYTMSDDPGSLQSCLAALEDSAVYQEMPPALRFVAELILDELASNTIKYGGDGRHVIEFRLDFDGERMQVSLVDDAQPFNPWQDAPVVDDSGIGYIGDISIGGRGIHMLQQATETWHYERTDGKNINLLIRSVRSPAADAA